ncbi:carbohydrate kinase family protein [Halostella litorea]|uniref:carbohydrate kinase family protein n=1 Tax=Halostella litorea TaxID=2528831 RepID=UPI0010923C45|nr:carbohydrate kinase [Halostella litorea]
MTHDVLVAGEALVDFLPENPGDLDAAEAFARRAGGAPANVAAALAALDRPPLFWTRVGDDPFGDFLVRTLAERGVPDEFVERDPGAKTTLSFVARDADGDRSFSFYRDGTADTRMRSGTVPDGRLEAVEWVHLGGVALAAEPSRSATLDLAERAAAAGCTVSFDPNYRPELWGSEAEFATVAGWAAEHADVLTATPAELRAMGADGDGPEALARSARGFGPHTVLLTLGDDGALAAAADDAPRPGVERHDGYPVHPVDATGAGDAFTAGAIAALLDGEPLGEAIAFANAVAAAATTATGAMAALPDRERVREIRGR